MVFEGLPIWENSPLLSLRWAKGLLDKRTEEKGSFPGDFCLLHIALQTPRAPIVQSLFMQESKAWHPVYTVVSFLENYGLGAGGAAANSTVASAPEFMLAEYKAPAAAGPDAAADSVSEQSAGCSAAAVDDADAWPEGLFGLSAGSPEGAPLITPGVPLADVQSALLARGLNTVRIFPSPLLQPLAATTAIDGAIVSLEVSHFWRALQSLYQSPQRTNTPYFRDIFLKQYKISLAAFERLRRGLLSEKSADVLLHSVPRHRGYSFRLPCIRRALETHISMLESRGRLEPGMPESLDVLFVMDTAGKQICRQRVTIIALVPLIALQTASLDAVLPWVLHVGSFNINFRCTLLRALEPELIALRQHGIRVHGLQKPVRLICASDMAAAWQLFDTADLFPVGAAHWLSTRTGIRSLTRSICSRCTSSLADIIAMDDSFESRMDAGLRIRGLELRMKYFYPRLHASLHGVPSWIGDVANLLWSQGKRAHARWIAKTFRGHAFQPLYHVTGPQPDISSDDDAGEADDGAVPLMRAGVVAVGDESHPRTMAQRAADAAKDGFGRSVASASWCA
jgi:hypothetical protein